MPILLVKLLISSICGALDAWGGYSWHNARRFIMPCVLAASVSFLTHTWWLGLTILPVIATLCLGYSDFGKGNFSRGCWLFVQYLICGIGCTLTKHLAWFVFLPYCILGGVLGGLLVSWWQPLGDFIEGFCLGSIVFLVY